MKKKTFVSIILIGLFVIVVSFVVIGHFFTYEVIQTLSTIWLAIFTFALALFTWELSSISKNQTKILEKQTEIQNAQFELDVGVCSFSKSEKTNNRLHFTIYVKNNSHSSIKIKPMECKSNHFCYFVEHYLSTLNSPKEEIKEAKTKTLRSFNTILIQKDDYAMQEHSYTKLNYELSENVMLDFSKEVDTFKNEKVILKLCYRPRRAKAKDEFIYFKFKIKDVLEYPDGSTVEITDREN